LGGGESRLTADQLQEQLKKKVYVGNLPFRTTEAELNALFSQFGKILGARIPLNEHGLSRGFAFIEFDAEADALKACEAMNGREFEQRQIRVNISNPHRHDDRDRGGFGYRMDGEARSRAGGPGGYPDYYRGGYRDDYRGGYTDCYRSAYRDDYRGGYLDYYRGPYDWRDRRDFP
jgi:RNA recognition motif-containing protein